MMRRDAIEFGILPDVIVHLLLGEHPRRIGEMHPLHAALKLVVQQFV
jgi:hypothetical protein